MLFAQKSKTFHAVYKLKSLLPVKHLMGEREKDSMRESKGERASSHTFLGKLIRIAGSL